MYYNPTSIQTLMDQVGWYDAIPPSTIVVDAGNKTSNGGTFFNSYHQVVTVENVRSTLTNPSSIDSTFNAYLLKMKRDGATDVLRRVFDLNPLAAYASYQGVTSINYAVDYTGLIASRIGLFDKAFGYSVCLSALQMFMTTARSNREQRIAGMSYESLAMEIEGIFDQYGKRITNGMDAKLAQEIQQIITVLFPTDANSSKKPTLTGIHPW